MSTKKIETLVDDIYAVLDPTTHVVATEEQLDKFAEGMKTVMRSYLAKRDSSRDGNLRLSQVGKPDRQVWLEAKGNIVGEPLPPATLMKFMYGNVLEEVVLFLAEQAGHEVRGQQDLCVVEGIKGSRDAVIDGVLIDVKTSSSYGFTKFKDGSVTTDHTFGYPIQLASYLEGSNDCEPDRAGWLAMEKSQGHLALLTVSKDNLPDPVARMKHIKEVVADEKMPPKCYEDVPDGQSGNRKLAVGCSYCKFREFCWPHARTFIYSNGPRYLTSVERTPNVFEKL